MEALFVLVSGLAFIAFLLPHPFRKHCAIIGWTCIIASIFADFPAYIAENNFMYPVFAVLGIPFLVVTIPRLWEENVLVFQLSRAAAIAFCIYVPFAYIPALGDALISIVVGQLMAVFTFFGSPVQQIGWNMLSNNQFRVEIILACTGIQSIAIMLGVAWAVPLTLRQRISSFLLIVPVIYVLNLARNLFVVTAYTEQWFPYLPEIASNGEFGYESFFWVHNVICELGALIALIAIAYAMFRLIPTLGEFAEGVVSLYINDLRRVAGRDR